MVTSGKGKSVEGWKQSLDCLLNSGQQSTFLYKGKERDVCVSSFGSSVVWCCISRSTVPTSTGVTSWSFPAEEEQPFDHLTSPCLFNNNYRKQKINLLAVLMIWDPSAHLSQSPCLFIFSIDESRHLKRRCLKTPLRDSSPCRSRCRTELSRSVSSSLWAKWSKVMYTLRHAPWFFFHSVHI